MPPAGSSGYHFVEVVEMDSQLLEALASLPERVAALEERSYGQSQRLDAIAAELEALRRDVTEGILRRLPYGVTIAITVLGTVIGAMGTLLVVR